MDPATYGPASHRPKVVLRTSGTYVVGTFRRSDPLYLYGGEEGGVFSSI